MPDPKFVVAVGSCAISGGVFKGSHTCMDGVDKVIPVDVYIPGCAPRPEAIIDGIVKLLSSLKEGEPVSDNGNTVKEEILVEEPVV
jgi:NADH:ubiquinone oxidoreductase subunit B-like Fe-S oxidoreductase